MPRTINQGFGDFLTKLTPSPTELNAAKGHRASIYACLHANFGLKELFQSGSFGNGTSISGYSDVDYFAVFPAASLTKNSRYSLQKIRDALSNRFSTTGVCISCPAVKLPFSNMKVGVEVVPSHSLTAKNGFPVFGIPDCSNNEWMLSSPKAHNAYVREIDKSLAHKVKPLIRLIKAWKYLRNVPISSFYLEMRVAKYAATKSSIHYGVDVTRILTELESNGLAKMQDPVGISGYLIPCHTQAQLADAKSKLATAAQRARNAFQAEKNGSVSDAFDWWRILYNYQFPAYS